MFECQLSDVHPGPQQWGCISPKFSFPQYTYQKKSNNKIYTSRWWKQNVRYPRFQWKYSPKSQFHFKSCKSFFWHPDMNAVSCLSWKVLIPFYTILWSASPPSWPFFFLCLLSDEKWKHFVKSFSGLKCSYSVNPHHLVLWIGHSSAGRTLHLGGKKNTSQL